LAWVSQSQYVTAASCNRNNRQDAGRQGATDSWKAVYANSKESAVIDSLYSALPGFACSYSSRHRGGSAECARRYLTRSPRTLTPAAWQSCGCRRRFWMGQGMAASLVPRPCTFVVSQVSKARPGAPKPVGKITKSSCHCTNRPHLLGSRPPLQSAFRSSRRTHSRRSEWNAAPAGDSVCAVRHRGQTAFGPGW